MNLVLDCSVAMSWCLQDEVTPTSVQLYNLFRNADALVPSFFFAEAMNTFISAERRGRLSALDTQESMEFLLKLPIIVDAAPVEAIASQVLDLARAHRLTGYDAAYLELAVRTKHPLVTYDQVLRQAAQSQGIELLPAN